MVDLTDPLVAYPPLREAHRRIVSDYFENLVRESGVDEGENHRTVTEIQSLEKEIGDVKRSLRKLRWVQSLSLLAGVPVGIWAATASGAYLVFLAVAVGGVILAFKLTMPQVAAIKENQSALTTQKDAKTAEAWSQMAPLNALHTWDVAPTFFNQVIPDVTFDGFLTHLTLTRLQSEFGLSPNFTDGRSMLAVQSGEFRQNPFVAVKYVHHWMGTRVYSGSIVIYWTERTRDSNGDWVNVQRSQTLTATVVKPCPLYVTGNVLLYGHDAAPSLSFSRTSSRLSGLDEGAVNDWRKQRAVSKVERKARRATMKGTSDFTVMANTEFEVLFKATDRDDEVEFRLLFTALAQQNMVKLLNDRSVGYGDDFSFAKLDRLSYLASKHLEGTDLQPDPRIFASPSLSHARQAFLEFHAEYFKSLYFTFAPLWTIPLFTDKAPLRRIPSDRGPDPVSTWELEAMANYIGEEAFEHPDSITTNILKVTPTLNPNGSVQATVYAYGYEGFHRVDVIPMRGDDGNVHPVPVPWTEYQPVVKESTMLVSPIENSQDESQWQDTIAAYRATGPWYQRSALAATILR